MCVCGLYKLFYEDGYIRAIILRIKDKFKLKIKKEVHIL